ncbi:Uncharacterised protein [Mycobacteroides abscessus]|nr:Uncharacterised protein [Mycobacteroides abscessus]
MLAANPPACANPESELIKPPPIWNAAAPMPRPASALLIPPAAVPAFPGKPSRADPMLFIPVRTEVMPEIVLHARNAVTTPEMPPGIELRRSVTILRIGSSTAVHCFMPS